MFGKLKEKLKGWIKGSSEKVEETAEKKEITEPEGSAKPLTSESKDSEPATKKPKKEKKKKVEKTKEEKQIEKAEKLIEKAKAEPSQPVPTKFDEFQKKTEPDLEEIKKEAETIKKEVKQAKKQEKELPDSKKDPAEILSEQPIEKIIKTIEERENESATEVSERIKDVKEEIIAEETEIPEKLPDEKKSFLSKFKTSFAYKITEEEFNEIFDDLEMLLLESNVALDVVDDIRKKLSEKLIGKQIKRNNLEAEIQNELKQTLNEILIEPDNPLDAIKLKKEKPFTILFFGINGTGKTTSISKLTHFLKKAGFSVALAAGDTFRAASIEQLTQHANKLDVPIIKHDYNADPSAVGYDAIQYAKKHQIDVVLIDTAGRMHTKQNLLAEMEKIVRVTKPDLKIFVAESIAGNDATEQAKAFHELIEIDGSILTKADIDEKGGTIISVSHTTNKPIFYLGTGQNYEDIELFNKQRFIENLGL